MDSFASKSQQYKSQKFSFGLTLFFKWRCLLFAMFALKISKYFIMIVDQILGHVSEILWVKTVSFHSIKGFPISLDIQSLIPPGTL